MPEIDPLDWYDRQQGERRRLARRNRRVNDAVREELPEEQRDRFAGIVPTYRTSSETAQFRAAEEVRLARWLISVRDWDES
jgi:hypothetical protein